MSTCCFCGYCDPPIGTTEISGRVFCRFCAASPNIVSALIGTWSKEFLFVMAHTSRVSNLMLQELAAGQLGRSFDPLAESNDFMDPEPAPIDFIADAWLSKGEDGLPFFIRRSIEEAHGETILTLARHIRQMIRRDVPALRRFTWEKDESYFAQTSASADPKFNRGAT